MDHRFVPLINTRLQPGVRNKAERESFQRLFSIETVETVFIFRCGCTGLKPGAIKTAIGISDSHNQVYKRANES